MLSCYVHVRKEVNFVLDAVDYSNLVHVHVRKEVNFVLDAVDYSNLVHTSTSLDVLPMKVRPSQTKWESVNDQV